MAVATSSGVQPTGIAWYDFLVLTVVAGLVAQIVRRTPTVVWAIAAATAALATGVVGVAGQLLLSAATISGWRATGPFKPRPATEYHELVIACASVGATASLLRLQDVLVPYSSAAIVCVVLVLAIAVGLPHFTPSARKFVGATSGAIAIAAIVVTFGAWISVRSLDDDARSAATSARDGVQLLRQGNTVEAMSNLTSARDELGRIDAELGGRWPTLALGVPLVSQNLQAVRTSTTNAERLLAASQSLGESASIDELLSDGSVNLQRIEELRNAIDELERVLDLGSAELAQSGGSWIAPPLQAELRQFSAEVTKAGDALRTIDHLAEILPGLLGAHHQRTYLVLATNPSEARELGGFAGGYAVVSANEGELSVLKSGRAAALNHSATQADVLSEDYPRRFLEHEPWRFGQNFTAMKDLPTLTRALADLFPNMSGQKIDGVLYLDPFALEALVALTGPVTIDSQNLTLSSRTTAEFFLTDQYELFAEQSDRTAVFEQLIAAFFERLGGEASLDASKVGRLIEVVRQDRLSFATLDPIELAALDKIGVAGSFGRPDEAGANLGTDFLAVSHLNAAPNKLDAFLKREITYDAVVDPVTGEVNAELIVTMRNETPDGLSDYVASNRNDLPYGTNRAVLVVHTPLELVATSKSPEPAFTRTFREFGLFRHEQVVVIPQGESRTISLTLAGFVAPGHQYELEVDHQPLIHPDDLTVAVRSSASESTDDSQRVVLTQDVTLRPILNPAPEPGPNSEP